MLADGVRDTPETLGAFINVAASGGRLKLAEKLINTMQAEHSIAPDKVHFAPVLTAYCRAGKPDRCLQVLQVR
jgi:pentatricopeptide repeat protein